MPNAEPADDDPQTIYRSLQRCERVKKGAALVAILVPSVVGFVAAIQDTYDGCVGPCYGVWTTQWTQTKGSIKESLPSLYADLNSSHPSLLQDVENHRCPFGTLLPGQVTWPRSDSSAVASMNWLKFLSVVWSYIPWVLVIVTLGVLLNDLRIGEKIPIPILAESAEAPAPSGEMSRSSSTVSPEVFLSASVDATALLAPPVNSDTREFQMVRYIGTKQLYVLVWLGIAIVLQEAVLKKALKRPRPGTQMLVRDYGGKYVGSCVPTCGMPSSHSMLATGWFTILFLDRISRVETLRSRTEDVDYCHSLGQFLRHLSTSYEAWSKGQREIDKYRFATHLVAWGVFLIPVPFARTELYDHTMEQSMYGSFFGIIVAFLWNRFCNVLQRRYKAYEGRIYKMTVFGKWDIGIKHNRYSMVTASDVFHGEWTLEKSGHHVNVRVDDVAIITYKKITAVGTGDGERPSEELPFKELIVKKAAPATLMIDAKAETRIVYVASPLDWKPGDKLHIDPHGKGREEKEISSISPGPPGYMVTLTEDLCEPHARGTTLYKVLLSRSTFKVKPTESWMKKLELDVVSGAEGRERHEYKMTLGSKGLSQTAATSTLPEGTQIAPPTVAPEVLTRSAPDAAGSSSSGARSPIPLGTSFPPRSGRGNGGAPASPFAIPKRIASPPAPPAAGASTVPRPDATQAEQMRHKLEENKAFLEAGSEAMQSPDASVGTATAQADSSTAKSAAQAEQDSVANENLAD